MKWTSEAEGAVSKVPFFIRKRVKKRVEEEAERQDSSLVTLVHVKTCQQRFLQNMDAEVKGFQVEACFGPTGCPNAVAVSPDLIAKLEKKLESRNLRDFLKGKVRGPLKLHHEFRVSLSTCPNACSRPQIADFGIIGALRPAVGNDPCTGCGACAEACAEQALTLPDGQGGPAIDFDRCLACGQCLQVCPTGTLVEGEKGYRVQVGGKLGRHPQLGRELPGIHSEEGLLAVLDRTLDHYQKYNEKGERLGEVLKQHPLV
ncbi:MAG: 4Fe-4S dicluster domain-containing protein [Deltaproteobacteria bacterium]|nr:4Fe-4S dicluster domain-containing protein [Deltaproteobacteria bacterium]